MTHTETQTHTHMDLITQSHGTHTQSDTGARTLEPPLYAQIQKAHIDKAHLPKLSNINPYRIYIHTYIHIFLSALRTHFLLPCLRAPRSWHFNTNMRFPAKRTNKTRQLQKRTSQSIVKLAPYHEYIFSFLSLLLIFSLLFLLLLKFYVLHARGISFAPTCAPFAKRTIKTQQL